MTQEDKDLLLKDLCGRLPYGVKTKVNVNQELARLLKPIFIGEDGEYSYMCPSIISINEDNIKYVFSGLFECKPLLFPLSSMTEEQKKFFKDRPIFLDSENELVVKEDFFGNSRFTMLDDWLGVINWCYENHFDIYGLIPMGLAMDATNLNVY